MNSIIETHDLDSSQLEQNPTTEFESEKKNRRKKRLNQNLNAASKGRNTIKPALEVEEIAHQYHNLKIEHNKKAFKCYGFSIYGKKVAIRPPVKVCTAKERIWISEMRFLMFF